MNHENQHPWLSGGATSAEETRAARLLASAIKDEQAQLARVSVRRINAGLAQRLSEGEWPSRHREPTLRWRWGLAAGLAAAGITLAVAVLRGEPSRLLEGQLLVEARGQRSVRNAGDRLPQAQLLETDDSPAVVQVGAAARLEVEPHTALTILDSAQIEVKYGAARFKVAKRAPGRSPFSVRTDEARVEVVGTDFEVRRADDGATWVGVAEGTVRVRSGGAQKLLNGGERWASRTQESLARSAAFDAAARLVQRGELEEGKRAYRNLSRADGPSAETALYLLARLEAQGFRRAERALAVLAEIDRRFPMGQLRAERALSRIESLLSLHRCDESREALSDFKATFPGVDPGLELPVGECR